MIWIFYNLKPQILYFYTILYPMVKLSDSKMPASKKDLKKNQQKKNVAAGIGDAQGRLPSQNKVG